MKYKPGRVHSVPDALSRLPVDMDSDTACLDDIMVPAEYYVHAVDLLRQGKHLSPVSSDAKSDARKATAEDWGREFQGLYDDSAFMCEVMKEQHANERMAGLIAFLDGSAEADDLPPQFKVECEASRHMWQTDSGILRRVVRRPAVKNKAGVVLTPSQILTPIALPIGSQLISAVLKSMHDHPTAAHIGMQKMLRLMQGRFYWKGWSAAVREYVRTCDLCQRYKALRRLKPSALLPYHSPRPFHTLGIDLIGPLPRARGMMYCLTVICHFSSWLWIVPIPSKMPEVVAKALYTRVILPMCIPLFILSDRGGEFVNKVLKHLCTLLRLGHKKSCSWHPQTNGKVENSHKFIKKSLAITVADQGRRWVDYVSELEFAWRHAPLAWASTTPFAVALGFEAPLPLDFLTASPVAIQLEGSRFHAAHLARLATTWQLMNSRRDEAEAKFTGADADEQPVAIYHEGSEVIAWLPSKQRVLRPSRPSGRAPS